MKPGEDSSVSGAVGSIAFELISAAVNGQKWEARQEMTRADDGSLDGGLDIHVHIEPPAQSANGSVQCETSCTPLVRNDEATGCQVACESTPAP
jgi:hypothetical protein